jgi:carbon starvation protein CstA
MVTLIISTIILILGYLFYSRYIERVFDADDSRPTPAVTMPDGVDYMPLPLWRIFLIQFLNIAGLGPIFGAVAGAMWGPVAYLWIILGSVFAGGVHDYFSGMLSIKHKGLSITEIVGIYMGKPTKQFMRAFTVILMIIVGAVFIMGPARILAGFTPGFATMTFWIWVVFIYYVLATMLPINKVIGRIYPVFGFALLFMAIGLITALLTRGHYIPELSLENFRNFHSGGVRFPVFPMLFITIACGAISGFHATQSPLMARCITSEKQGRPVFYGAMITEGVVAMIWATISMSIFGGIQELNTVMNENHGNAAWVVNEISNSLLGKFGAVLALLGVVAAPITSGDTAFRSARLIVADFLKLGQKSILNRLMISFPLFAVGYLLTRIDFAVVWRYFAWSNQTLATIVLWTITVYLVTHRKNYWITLLPALFMTAVITTYILYAPEGFSLSKNISYAAGLIITFFSLLFFMLFKKNSNL